MDKPARGPERSSVLRPGNLAELRLSKQVEAEGFWLPLSALSEGERGLWRALVAELETEPEPSRKRPIRMISMNRRMLSHPHAPPVHPHALPMCVGVWSAALFRCSMSTARGSLCAEHCSLVTSL